MEKVKYDSGFKRLAAAIIDGLLLWIVSGSWTAIIVGGVWLVLKALRVSNLRPLALLAILVFFCSVIVWEIVSAVVIPYYTNGQTIGKKLMKIRVITLDGSKLTIVRLFIRELFLQIILAIGTFGALLLLLVILTTEKKQGLHDLIVNTAVIDIN